MEHQLAPIRARLHTAELALGAHRRTHRIDAADTTGARRVAAGFGILHAVYAAKLHALASALARALAMREYLIYAAAGRMLIEHVAILIYYGQDKIEPLLKRGNPVGLGPEQTEALGDVLDQFLSGRRHDWQAIMGPHVPPDLQARRPSRQQVNILTCLKRWYRRDPAMEDLYSIFCDMVHPNVGSLFLFLHRDGDTIVAADPGNASLAEAVVLQTAPQLLAILERCPEILDQLAHVADAAAWAASKGALPELQ